MTITSTFDKQNFLASLKPGITTLVVSSFENLLREKLDGIVQEIYDELKEQLPKRIESRIGEVFTEHFDREMHIQVELIGD